MTTRALNEELLPGNRCFGCGPDNPDGLQIRIFRDGERDDRLVGRYTPRDNSEGFPHIVHGGLQYTALDCMAAWVVLALRAKGRVIPLTRSATMRYLRPARVGQSLALSASVARESAAPRDPFTVHTELRDAAGELLSEADFEYVLLPEERFMKAVGIDVMPDSYRHHFGDRW